MDCGWEFPSGSLCKLFRENLAYRLGLILGTGLAVFSDNIVCIIM